jgi:hypothetical protein
MVSVNQQVAWMPSTIGGENSPSRAAPEIVLTPPREIPEASSPSSEQSFFGEDGFSFGDILDAVNPLQHIPLISTFYRESTGDDIAVAPRVMGSTLYFGPLGLVGALANVFVENNTGKDIGQHMASWITPTEPSEGEVPNDGAIQTAQNGPSATPDPHDPVLAWAQREADWARQNVRNSQKSSDKPAEMTAPGTINTPKDTPDNTPDAGPWLRDTPVPSQMPRGIEQMATLTSDIRSAARAYEIAANLNTG